MVDKTAKSCHTLFTQPFPMDFSSVDDFLRKAALAKKEKLQTIDDELADFIDDPSVVGVPTELAATIEQLLYTYGDETFKQIGLFCFGKWLAIHSELVDDHKQNESWDEALHTMNDVGKLSAAMQIIEQIGSFGGDDEWRRMLRNTIGQAVAGEIDNHLEP